VIGARTADGFRAPIDSKFVIRPLMRLLVAGQPEDLSRLMADLSGPDEPRGSRRVLIVGFGRSGKAAASAFAGAEVELVVIDAVEQPGVDVVGDARDPEVYQRAVIEGATAVILDLDDDTVATLAALIIRNMNPGLYILAGANDGENERKLRRAGADYVQSLASVTARMAASTIFDDEEVLALEEDVEVVGVGVGEFARRTLSESGFRQGADCTILAVVRSGEIITRVDPARFTFSGDDRLIVAGTRAGLRRFEDAHLKERNSR
jgi:Trk K+ transport system NAD-binding subunit